MAVGYRTEASHEHGSDKMRDAVVRGLAFWYRTQPAAENWWSNEIGRQLALEPILILMADDLPTDLLQAGLADLHDPVELASYRFTGQNLMWCAAEQFVRGVLRRSDKDIAAAVRTMQSLAKVTTDTEGIQYDHSFHQHGPQLYVGGYGLNFLKDATTYARLVQGTHFAYGADPIMTLSDYLLDGARLMVRGKMLDPGAIGRDIAREGAAQEALSLLPVLDNMGVLDPEKKPIYETLKAHIQGTGPLYSFLGHKHFWDSDFTVHQRPGYYVSVKMVSARTFGTEKVNGENLKGYWLPFGLTYIARRGDEYLDIFPTWDWGHLPGVTSPEEVPPFLSHVDQPNTFVGGVSDGIYGAAAMKVDVDTPASIHAHKAWFFFDDEMVALGAGISSTSSAAVNTTLNQCLRHGDVLADGQTVPPGRRTLQHLSWVLHDGVGYVFPQKPTASISTGMRNGSWAEINSLQSKVPVTKNVFALWLTHGIRPHAASYQYVVVPDTDTIRLSAYAVNIPIRVVANTTDLQAVQHERLGITQMVFYSPGRLSLGQGLSISVDAPCMLMLTEKSDAVKLAASTPRGPLQLHVVLERSGRVQPVTFDVRGGPSLGASQTKAIELPADREWGGARVPAVERSKHE
jgi:chondroitin AC lyase